MRRDGNFDVAPGVPPLGTVPQRRQHSGREELPRDGFGNAVQRYGAGLEEVIFAGVLLLGPGVDSSLKEQRVNVPLVAFVDGDWSGVESFGCRGSGGYRSPSVDNGRE